MPTGAHGEKPLREGILPQFLPPLKASTVSPSLRRPTTGAPLSLPHLSQCLHLVCFCRYLSLLRFWVSYCPATKSPMSLKKYVNLQCDVLFNFFIVRRTMLSPTVYTAGRSQVLPAPRRVLNVVLCDHWPCPTALPLPPQLLIDPSMPWLLSQSGKWQELDQKTETATQSQTWEFNCALNRHHSG